MTERPLQYSLGTLLAVVTAANLWMAYFRFVGFRASAIALLPPLILAAGLNALLFSQESWGITRPSQEYRSWETKFPAKLRMLISLVFGFLVWLSVLALIVFYFRGFS